VLSPQSQTYNQRGCKNSPYSRADETLFDGISFVWPTRGLNRGVANSSGQGVSLTSKSPLLPRCESNSLPYRGQLRASHVRFDGGVHHQLRSFHMASSRSQRSMSCRAASFRRATVHNLTPRSTTMNRLPTGSMRYSLVMVFTRAPLYSGCRADINCCATTYILQ